MTWIFVQGLRVPSYTTGRRCCFRGQDCPGRECFLFVWVHIPYVMKMSNRNYDAYVDNFASFVGR